MALGIVIILSSISILILEYIVPFSRNVKWLDQYTQAYYLSTQWVEEALYSLSNGGIWSEYNQPFWTGMASFSYQTASSWSILPAPWKWESDFDSDRGIIGPNKPLHLYLPPGINWGIVNISLRIPNFDGDSSTTEALDPSLSTQDIVNWQLSSSTDVLNSTATAWSRFIGNDICPSTGSCAGKTIFTAAWIKLDGSLQNLWNFFFAHCWVNYACNLKLSLVNSLLWTSWWVSWKKIPYIEYKIDFAGVTVPYDKVHVDTSWKSYGFKKDFSVDFPLKFVNEAFDFTILQ